MWDKKIKPRPSKTTISKQEEFEEIMGMTTEEAAVRAQLQSQEGITFVAQYRNYLQADFYLYKNIQGQWNNYGQIGDTILHNKVMALLAREYQIKPQAFFQYLEYADKDACTFLNAAYQEDFSDDNLEIVSFYSKWYKYLFGVGIKARIGWDGDKKSNIFQYVDPRIWVPDPDGDYASGDYAYTGFEKMYDEANLYGQGWLNMDKIIPMQFSAYSQQLQKYKDQQLDYLPNMGTNPVTNAWYDIYLHYGKAQDKQGIERKYRIILGNDRKLPLFIELLPATCEAQKKNPSLISFPFAFEYWNPEPNNPFGNRPANYIRNVEEAKRLLMTLQLKKVKAELYPMYFYNEKYIGNKSDLQFGFNKFIGVNTEDDGPVPLDNIITAFRPDSSSGNTMQINQMLDQQVDRSTFMSDNQLGQQATGDPSATQTNVVQTNSDLNLALPAKISTW